MPGRNDQTIRIQRLTPDDADLFRTIRLEALRTTPLAFCASHDVEAAEPAAAFAGRLQRNAVFGAFAGDDVIGMAGFSLSEKNPGRGLVWGMYVRPDRQGQGIGARLLAAVMDHARDLVETLGLSVVAENDGARALYERHGFRETGSQSRHLPDDGRMIREILMDLSLRS
ncbi:ribosomal protein S18 acetylase RimI-like enzyme [Dongia mobilis]|uniref:Ribosomal protein S18 acetylase RimI-like enzyme n=1 Tax=Dongia mobilis TaxID=578943 RepID=A0A4R6WML6_9PROT|nr:GNAT family N-acetyltransferase [Dongia mobilis]TDQ82259.1 ribosomal protein S18 acetylase RimI-like enzyme [Dongia mobilis]